MALPAQALQMPTVDNSGIENLVRTQFADAPDMIAIAKCESGYRQYDSTGQPLHGGLGKENVGVFQINETVHAATAQALGMDIYTTEGNLAYARYLYDHEGTKPWVSCWQPTAMAVPPVVTSVNIPTTTLADSTTLPTTVSTSTTNAVAAPTAIAPTISITQNLSMGVTSPQVQALQQLLNSLGFILASSGPGSPGNETTRFGSLTREAVRKFQCAKNIVCDGNENTTGYGFVGRRTRAALNSAQH